MILSVKTIGKCGAACLLELKSCVVLMSEIGLVCWQLVHDKQWARGKFLVIQPSCKLSLFFLMKMSELCLVFLPSSCDSMPRAFERNQNSLKNSSSDVLETNSLTLMISVEIFF